MSWRTLPRRMLRAALFDAHVYEEVEADRSAIGQALTVVLLACAAAAIGTWLRDGVLGGRPLGDLSRRIAIDVVTPLVLWLGGSFFSYMVGLSFFRGPHTHSDYREVLRTTGFAFTPALLDVFSFVPLGGLLVRGADLWVLACGIVAVRQALDFTTLRAVGTFGLAYALLLLLLTGLLIALPV